MPKPKRNSSNESKRWPLLIALVASFGLGLVLINSSLSSALKLNLELPEDSPLLVGESRNLSPTLSGSQSQLQEQEQEQEQQQLAPQESTHATVMGMATNYGVGTYKRFVGSLRRSGYQGNIILIISLNPEPGVEEYLSSQNVTMKRLNIVNCSTIIMKKQDSKKQRVDPNEKEVMTCADPYPDLKIRWGRFGLLRDYLDECKSCTGPVLVADVRDTFFQRDPFGPEAPPIPPGQLQVFREHRKMRTTHWLVRTPVEVCKQIKIFDEPMLCSGTTIGTRDAMLQYLADMVTEMRLWMQNKRCCCNKMSGDDQSIHNYLYYAGKLPYASPQDSRVGLVNTVGSQGAMLFNKKRKIYMEEVGLSQPEASLKPYTSEAEEKEGLWLGLENDLTDSQGFFIDFNGERSFIIHQFDRFGRPLEKWLDRRSGLVQDPY